MNNISKSEFPVNPSDTEIMIDENDVLFKIIDDKCAIITLNRPRKLNSLNVSMIDKLIRFYLTESKSPVNLFIQKSSTPKAYCAGGDVVALAKFNNANHSVSSVRLFENEYSLNYFYSRFKKPVISFINGITMGGGCGLSVHSPFRVVTETTRLAMPEMAIGFFPDVGASYFFSRLDGYLGWYICLAGDIVYGYGNMMSRIGTHYVESSKLDALEKELVSLSLSYNFDYRNATGHYNEWYMKVNETIERFASGPPQDFKYQYTQENLKIINDMFSKTDTIEGVFDYCEDLASKGNQFARETLKKFNERSLLSIKIGYRIMKYSASHTSFESLSAELRLGKNMNFNAKYLDLNEGIYKKLILKTNDYKWKFKDIHDIPDSFVDKYCFQEMKPYGNLIKFEGNYALFKDDDGYPLNKFTFPSASSLTGDFDSQSYAQYRNKKGLKEYIEFIRGKESKL